MENLNSQEELENTPTPETEPQPETAEELAAEPADIPETESADEQITEAGDAPELSEALDLEAIIQEFSDAAPVTERLTEEPVSEESVPISGDTIRMDLSQLPKMTVAEPVQEDPIPAVSQKAEPFSDQWEPEYEQPMGEYVPPQPIVFHPQSRFRELKKKLVSGPERQYYKLAEKGTGKLQALLLLSILVAAACIGATVLDWMEKVAPAQKKLMVFSQLLCMALSALIASYQLIDGLADMLRKRFSLNSLLIFSLLLCGADGFMCLKEERVPCCAAFSLLVIFSLFDTLHRRRTEMSQMDVLRKATDLTALRTAAENLDGRKVLLRTEGQVEDFMDHYNVRSVPERIRTWYALGALIATLGVGVIGFMVNGTLSSAFHVASITLFAAVPASFFVCLSRPADILQQRFHKLGTVLCGWKGICTTKGTLVFSVNHNDLFPAGTVKMNGVKFYGSRDPDEVVAYGTALILADNNGLAPLFEQILESRNCHHLTAQNLQIYDGGIGGDVRGEAVLVGDLAFLKQMGVEIPDGLRVSQAVCVAIEGQLSGLFAVSYEKNRRVFHGLHTLCSYKKLKTVVCDGDFLLTPSFLQSRFGINPNRISFANPHLRSALEGLEADPNSLAAVLSTQHDLASLAFGITGARALRTTSIVGTVIHLIGGILGIGIMLTLTVLGALYLITPMNVILYQLIWCIPGILLTEWSRLI